MAIQEKKNNKKNLFNNFFFDFGVFSCVCGCVISIKKNKTKTKTKSVNIHFDTQKKKYISFWPFEYFFSSSVVLGKIDYIIKYAHCAYDFEQICRCRFNVRDEILIFLFFLFTFENSATTTTVCTFILFIFFFYCQLLAIYYCSSDNHTLLAIYVCRQKKRFLY